MTQGFKPPPPRAKKRPKLIAIVHEHPDRVPTKVYEPGPKKKPRMKPRGGHANKYA